MEEFLYELIGSACLVAVLLAASRGVRKRAHFWLWAVLSFLVIAAAGILLDRFADPLLGRAGLRGAVHALFLFAAAMAAARAVCPKGFAYYANIALCGYALAVQLFAFFFAVWTQELGRWNLLVGFACAAAVPAVQDVASRRFPPSAVQPALSGWAVALFSALVLAALLLFGALFPPAAGADRTLRALVAAAASFTFIALALQQQCAAALRKAARDRAALRDTLQGERDLHAREQAMMDVINMHSHDLKYRLWREEQKRAARGSAAAPAQDPPPAPEEKIAAAVDTYEHIYHTGNDALDVVLAAKARLCGEQGIQFDCMAEGSLLSFWDEADVYTFFGNILDNAVEAASRLSDRQKRVISLHVERRRGFAVVREENYFTGALAFENGLPRTTKRGGLHGYGLRSVRRTAERYGGALSCSAKEDRFLLKAVFPLPRGAGK